MSESLQNMAEVVRTSLRDAFMMGESVGTALAVVHLTYQSEHPMKVATTRNWKLRSTPYAARLFRRLQYAMQLQYGSEQDLASR